MKKTQGKRIAANLVVLTLISFLLINLMPLIFATPTGPNTINVTANETKQTTGGVMVNISGGRIATLNVTATVQNPHWKAFVGDINGKFTLDDSSGSTIYDWTLSAISGEVYATRNSSSISWGSIACANRTHMNTEEAALISLSTDNISSTFINNNTNTYVIATTTITPNQCKAINTYVNNVTQGTSFEEIVLQDGSSHIVYSTVIENNVQGFDGGNYDFQMIVPENASQLWTSSTPYYIYVEVS